MPKKTDLGSAAYSLHRESEGREKALKLVATGESGRPAEASERSKGIIVLGMHRTGTSAITSVLVSLGFELPGEPVPASWDNPKGYWEPREIVEIHDDFLHAVGRSWSDPRPLAAELFEGDTAEKTRERLRRVVDRAVLPRGRWVLKDPRMCRLLPLWEGVLEAEMADLHVLHMLRSPLSVADSLYKRDGFGKEKSLLLWLRHYLESEAASRGQDRTFLHYEGLSASSPVYAVESLRAAIGSPWLSAKHIEGAIEGTLDRSLMHYSHSLDETLDRLRDYPWVATAYRALDWLGTDRDADGRAQLDELRAEMRTADKLLADPTVWGEELHGERYYWLRQEIEIYHRSVEAQRREIEAQRAEVDAMREAFHAERKSLEAIREEIVQQDRAAESWRQELLRSATETGQERLLEDMRQAMDGEHERLRAMAESVSTILERQGAAETERQAMAGSLSALVGQGQLLEGIRQAMGGEHERLGAMAESVSTIRERQGAAETERQAMAESLSALVGQGQLLEGIRQAMGGEHERLGAMAESVSTIRDLITERIEKHHLALLSKSLDVTARLESQWVEARDERDRTLAERDALEGEKRAALAALASTAEERDRALAERDASKQEEQAALVALASAAEERDRALAERDASKEEEQTALAALASAAEERDRALAERNASREEKQAALAALASAAEERDQALAERNALRAEKQAALAALASAAEERDRALQELASSHSELDRMRFERDQAHQEVAQLLGRWSWRMTSPLRSLYKAVRNVRYGS